jgi:uncharacterized membrane protein
VTILALYAAALAIFLAVDVAWLKLVAAPMFRREVGAIMLDDPRMGVAAAFYLAYVAGVVYFAAAPALDGGGAWRAAFDGALFGLFCYGTYEATNLATLKGWTPRMAVIDTLWGGFVTAITAAGAVIAVG